MNATLDQIKKMVISTFNQKYGYCGLAEGDNFVILNSGGDGENFIITFIITIKDCSVQDEKVPKNNP
jgi:hypothetical protein